MINLEVRPAEGGDDALSFAKELFGVYVDFATRKG